MRTDAAVSRRSGRALPLAAAVLLAWSAGGQAHVDSALLPEDCGSCHVGHGLPGEPMLAHAEEELCFRCHGAEEARTREIAEGRLAPGADLPDLEREFRKPYRHPVREGVGHSPTERLDGARIAEIRHAECVDCHNPHQRMAKQGVLHEVPGLSVSGQMLETSLFEHQVCLKCHGDRPSAGSPAHTLREEFAPDAVSQHPVTRAPTGRSFPSLLPAAVNRRLDCSDCHGNDDPDGPRGPHGSMHEYLLAGYYDRGTHTDESPLAFELCYGCHDRESILADDSFPYHSLHLLGDPLTGTRGTSCFTCHASHGSPDSPGLIRFNPQAVGPGGPMRSVSFRQTGVRSGECALTCHGREHSPEVYR